MKLFFLIIFTFASSAFAKLYGEPYIGFSNGSGTSKYTSSEYNHEYSGRLIGLRTGWVSSSGLFYSLDYSINQFILDTEQSGAYADDEVSRSQVGLLVGKSFGAAKLWATYFLQSEIEGCDSASTGSQFMSSNDLFDGGSGFGIGFSYFIFKGTQLCLEYRSLSYDNASSSGSSVTNYTSTDLSEYVVSVSFPFGGGK